MITVDPENRLSVVINDLWCLEDLGKIVKPKFGGSGLLIKVTKTRCAARVGVMTTCTFVESAAIKNASCLFSFH